MTTNTRTPDRELALLKDSAPAPRPKNPYEQWPEERRSEFYGDLRRFMLSCPRDRNHLVIVLANVCIDHGINQIGWIVTTLTPLGFNPKHVATVMTKSMGDWWTKDELGALTLIPRPVEA